MMQEWIERRVEALFGEMFPPGSEGPPEGFRIGDLYEQATREWYELSSRQRIARAVENCRRAVEGRKWSSIRADGECREL